MSLSNFICSSPKCRDHVPMPSWVSTDSPTVHLVHPERRTVKRVAFFANSRRCQFFCEACASALDTARALIEEANALAIPAKEDGFVRVRSMEDADKAIDRELRAVLVLPGFVVDDRTYREIFGEHCVLGSPPYVRYKYTQLLGKRLRVEEEA